MIITRPANMGNCFSCGNPSNRTAATAGLRGALGALAFLGTDPPTGVADDQLMSAQYEGVQRTAIVGVGVFSLIMMSVMAAGAGLAGYHGYKRSGGKVGSTIGWTVLGGLFPIITVPVALAQGYGKRS